MESEYSLNNVEEHVRGSHKRHVVRSSDSGRELGVIWRWGSPIVSLSHKSNTSISYGYIPSITWSDWDKPRIKQQGQSTRDSNLVPAKSSHGDSRSADQPLRLAPVNINREVSATHTERQSPTFLDSVNILAQAKGTIWRLLNVTQFANILWTAVPTFYGIQYLKKEKKAAALQTDVGNNITEGKDCLTASHRALITDVAGNVFLLAEYRRSFGINFKYIGKKNPSITNHRFLLLVHRGYYNIFRSRGTIFR